MNNSDLEFRKIPSLNLLYEINENGTILRNAKSKKQIKIKLDMHHSKSGYYMSLITRNNKTQRLMIHKLVAECWLGPKPDGLEIDHIDRNSHNNDYRNLRYVTHSQQMKNRVFQPDGKVIAAATANVMKYVRSIQIAVEVDGVEYPSLTEAARQLAAKHNVKTEHIRAKLKKRYACIFGHTIKYLGNAETRRAHSSE